MRRLLSTLVVGVAALATSPAAAQPAPGAATGTTAPGRVELIAQDAWSPIGGELHLRVRIPDSVATPGATLSLVAYQQITTRAAFDRVIQSEATGSVLDQVVVPIAVLASGDRGTRDVTVGIEGVADDRDPSRLSLRRTGVYPLAVEVFDADQRSQGRFLTTAVVVAVDQIGRASDVDQRLGVAWIWPLTAGPSTLPDGSDDPAVTRSLRPSGRLGRQAVALTRAGDVPLTLVPGPETLEAWSRQGEEDPAIARGAAAVRDASGRDQIVTGPYVPSDLPSLLSVGLDSTVDAELVRGDETLARLLGTRPDVRTAIARPVDPGSLARLRARGVDRVVVDGDSLATSSRSQSTRPFLLQPAASLVPSGPISALAGDAAIERLLEGAGAPALRAQHALSALAIVALEEPAARRAITVINRSDLDAPTDLLDAMLTGLRGHPLLEPMTVDDVFATVTGEGAANGAPLTRELGTYSPPEPPVGPAGYRDTQTRLDHFRSLAGPADAIVLRGERSLLVCEAATFVGPAGVLRAQETLNSIDVEINGFVSRIRIPRPSTITLTSRSGEIPLTFRNDTGQPLDVYLELSSAKLKFPAGSTRTVRLPTKSTTVRVPVESRTSGTFPLQLSVMSADATFPVANSTFRVRSTAFSAVGIALMLGAAVFLVGWWAVHIRRNRRARRVA
ncbi:MAG TPA: DUF6049 family protein [Acidimicrobiia bacterium]